MLKDLFLRRYKMFKDDVYVPIKPLTLLCGANNSGKSTLLQTHLALGEVNSISKLLKAPYLYYRPGGTLVDEDWTPFVTTFTISEDDGSFDDLVQLYHMFEDTEADSSCYIRSFAIKHTLIVLDYVEKCKVEINVIDGNGAILCESSITFEKAGSSLRNRYRLSFINLPVHNDMLTSPEDEPIFCDLENDYLAGSDKKGVALDNVINKLFEITLSQYSHIKFILASRDLQMHDFCMSINRPDAVGVRGEYVAELLDTIKKSIDPVLTTVPVPEWYSDVDLDHGIVPIPFYDCIDAWLAYFGYGKLSINYDSDTIFLGTTAMCSISYSVYQLLPILVQCLYMKPGDTLFIEHPEAHLDSTMQMKLADFLLAVAVSGRQLIVETHSDHIINRIARRVMEINDSGLYKQVQPLFVEKNSEGYSTVNRDIEIDPVKGWINCPPEFFRQYANELRVIIKRGLANSKSAVKPEDASGTQYF